MDKKNPPRHYSIGKIAKELDLPAYTIRYWETEFKQLNPKKSRSGRRVYNQEDLKLVKHIQDLLHKQGYTIKGAREALEGKLKAPQPQQATSFASQMPSEREIYLEDKTKELEQQLKELEQQQVPQPEKEKPQVPTGPTEREDFLEGKIKELERQLEDLQKLRISEIAKAEQELSARPSEKESLLENKIRELQQRLKTQSTKKVAPVPAGPSKREIYLEKKLVSMKKHLLELMEIISGRAV